jgi:hypothetical protein
VQVLPPGSNKQQKIACGDSTGVMQVFSVKRGEVEFAYKGLPSAKKVLAVRFLAAPGAL